MIAWWLKQCLWYKWFEKTWKCCEVNRCLCLSRHTFAHTVSHKQSLTQLTCSYEAENQTRYLVCDLGNPMKSGTSVSGSSWTNCFLNSNWALLSRKEQSNVPTAVWYFCPSDCEFLYVFAILCLYDWCCVVQINPGSVNDCLCIWWTALLTDLR